MSRVLRGAPLFAVGLTLVLAVAPARAQDPHEVPVVKGDAGPCSADFAVSDASGRPIYNARIRVLVRYGFAGARKTELEAGTNADGKARFEGLPQKPKGALEYTVQKDADSKTVTQDPRAKCQARFAVSLGTPPKP